MIPFNPFSALTSKIFGGLLALSLSRSGPGTISDDLRARLEPLTQGSPVDTMTVGLTAISEAEAEGEAIPDELIGWCRNAALAVAEHGFHGKGDLAEAFLAAHPEEEPQEQ